LRDAISIAASEAGIDILSIQPLAPEKIEDFLKNSFSVRVNATYDELGNFMSNIENLPNYTKVDLLSLGSHAGIMAGREDRGTNILKPVETSITLTISGYSNE
jgi:Tfp pilus assembly protein PilO